MPLAKLVADWAQRPTYQATIDLLQHKEFNQALRYALNHPATRALLAYIQSPSARRLFPELSDPMLQRGISIAQHTHTAFYIQVLDVVKQIIIDRIIQEHRFQHPRAPPQKRGHRWNDSYKTDWTAPDLGCCRGILYGETAHGLFPFTKELLD